MFLTIQSATRKAESNVQICKSALGRLFFILLPLSFSESFRPYPLKLAHGFLLTRSRTRCHEHGTYVFKIALVRNPPIP